MNGEQSQNKVEKFGSVADALKKAGLANSTANQYRANNVINQMAMKGEPRRVDLFKKRMKQRSQ